MRITSKGQVTIPIEYREKFGLLPNTEAEFIAEGDRLVIVRSKAPKRTTGGAEWVRRMRGAGDIQLSTDEIMALTRGE